MKRGSSKKRERASQSGLSRATATFGSHRLLWRIPDPRGRDVFVGERLRPLQRLADWEAPEPRMVIEIIRRDMPEYALASDQLFWLAKMLSARAHPNLVKVISADEHADGASVAFEHLEGWSLERLVLKLREKRVAIPLEIICWVAIQTLRAIEVGHPDHGHASPLVALLDISPANILISRSGHLKLSHLAFAPADPRSKSPTLPSANSACIYLAPEYLRDGDHSIRSAIYSVGAVVWELLTGKPPFAGQSAYALVANILAGARTHDLAREGVPRGLADIVERATNLRPSDRYSSTREMIDVIECWLGVRARSLTAPRIARFLAEPGRGKTQPPLRHGEKNLRLVSEWSDFDRDEPSIGEPDAVAVPIIPITEQLDELESSPRALSHSRGHSMSRRIRAPEYIRRPLRKEPSAFQVMLLAVLLGLLAAVVTGSIADRIPIDLLEIDHLQTWVTDLASKLRSFW